MLGTRQEFQYHQCSVCECLQIAHIPDDIGAHYPKDYYSYDLRRHKALKRLRRGRRRRWVLTAPSPFVLLASLFSSSDEMFHLYRRLGLQLKDRLLDVGTGSGGHVLDLRDAGVEGAVGLDPFVPESVRIGNDILVYKLNLDEMKGEFDFITFHHSLEHMPDQIEPLAQAKRLLAENGKVLVRVPTVTSEAFERYGADWVALDAPRHFFLHSHKSIAVVAGKAGLKVDDLWCDSSEMQFMGSEQYKRGIALTDPRSAAYGRKGRLFSGAQRRTYRRKTRQLNRSLRGDSICVLMSIV